MREMDLLTQSGALDVEDIAEELRPLTKRDVERIANAAARGRRANKRFTPPAR